MDNLTSAANITDQMDDVVKHLGARATVIIYSAVTLVVFVTALIPPAFANWTCEYTLFTFASSVQYLMAGELAFICFWIVRYLNKHQLEDKHRAWLWLPVALAMLFVSCDEILKIHEKAGSKLEDYIPVMEDLYSRHTSDLFLVAYVACALLFSVMFIRELRSVKRVRLPYIAGLVLIVLAVVIDTLLVNTMRHPVLVYAEELAEFYAGTTFTVAFLLFFLDRSRLALLLWWNSCQHPRKIPITGSLRI